MRCTTEASSKKVIRQVWKQIHIWLQNDHLRLHIVILVDFGDIFYNPEMEFAKHSTFQAVFMPRRSLARLQTLKGAFEHPESYFVSTFDFAQMRSVSPETLEQIKDDIKAFITECTDVIEPEAKVWLSFPHISCGLGRHTLSPKHLLLAEREEQVVTISSLGTSFRILCGTQNTCCVIQ